MFFDTKILSRKQGGFGVIWYGGVYVVDLDVAGFRAHGGEISTSTSGSNVAVFVGWLPHSDRALH